MINIILGTAHLKSTPGKCSPDKRLFEYKYSRELVQHIYSALKELGYSVFIDVAEEDLKGFSQKQELQHRVKFLNSFKEKSIYVSVHVNGAGDGTKWMNATGWECWTTPGNNNSDKLATCLYAAADSNLKGQVIRKDFSDKDPDKEGNLYVLKNSKWPAVLTENFFQDNKKDVDFLLSEEGFQSLVRLHVEGIVNYIKKN